MYANFGYMRLLPVYISTPEVVVNPVSPTIEKSLEVVPEIKANVW